MSVMVKRCYRSRKNQFIIITISTICIIYYICLNSDLQREPDLDVTRRNARFDISSKASSAVVRLVGKIKEVNDKNRNARFNISSNASSSVVELVGKNDRVNAKNRNARFNISSNASSSVVELVDKNDRVNDKNRNSVIELIENRFEEALKEDKGSGCEMPKLDPFALEVMQIEQMVSSIKCPGKDWVKCYLSECRVVDEILSTTANVVCYYQDIIHDNDHYRHLSAAREVKGSKPYILDASDHVKVKCTGVVGKSAVNSTWEGYHLGFRKSVPRVRPPRNREDTLNVLIFGFDSTSKNGFIRKMPKSFKYLKDDAKATILNGYNIVGDGTPAALFPILTGKTELELPDVRKGTQSNATLDDMPFIFYKLNKDGYRTAYLEDMPWIGTFQHRFKGFRHHQPADHYLRSFFIEETNHGDNWYKPQIRFCVGDTPQYQLMMNITDQFLRLDGKKFCFTFIADITHDDSMISVADDDMLDLLRTLEKRKVFEDTLLIVMGDHGPRFAKIRNTLQGKLEERLPLMSVRLPDKLKRTRPDAQAQLEAKANILTTPHDIHATILDVLNWSEHMNPFKVNGADFPRAMTLLGPIPKNRSCSEAGIQPHWCACANWKNVTDSEMVRKTVDAFINYINQLTESQRSKCLPRKLTEVQWVMSQRPNNKMLSFVSNKDKDGFLGKFGTSTNMTKENYQLKVVVSPGRGIYEASMLYLKKDDKFLINTRDISRINAYGNEPSCISTSHPHLNPFCYCRDYVPQAP